MVLDDAQEHGACIKVIGVGGGGGNAVNSMVDSGVEGVQFIVANTDKQALANNLAEIRIQIGEQRTHGLGAGSMPSVGQEAAQESSSMIQEHLKGADMVFITAGMGGGTGTGAAPVIAGIARQLGALTVGVVTKPFKFEGARRRRQAEEGIENLKKNVDTLITIPNQRLLQTAGEQMTLVDAFRQADSDLVDAVRSISELIIKTGFVNTDFADVRTVMSNKGLALMGTGVGEGPNRATDAAEAAISSPLLDDISLEGASSVLLNITAPRSATLAEISEAASLIEEATAEDAHLIWGHVLNEDDSSEEIKITIIATGFGNAESAADDFAKGTKSNFLGNYDGTSGVYGSQSRLPAVAAQSSSSVSAVIAAQTGVGYQDSMRADSFEIAQRMKEVQDQADELYASGSQRTVASYAPTGNKSSYAPTGNAGYPASNGYGQNSRSDNYAVADIYAQMQKPVTQAEHKSSPSNPPVDVSAALSDSFNLDEDDYDQPAFIRKKNAGKKSFLD